MFYDDRRASTAAVLVATLAVWGAACSSADTSETDEPPLVLASGTTITATLDQEMSTAGNDVGDEFTATVSRDVTGAEGVIVPRGSRLRGEVTAVQQAGGDRPAAIKLDFREIEVRGQVRDFEARLASASPETRKEMDGEAKKIGGGAAAGALLGGIIGGGAKEAVLGAAAGAAAGTAVTLGTRDSHAYLPEGSTITVRVDAPVEVPRPAGGE